ncbi:MAG: diaminopimelate dehydrogenase [Dehalococcoidales bacterium]|nr:diaminopimelate dehydrogenase [Dehalococcoidales bacterium]
MINIAIVGYGNVARGVHKALKNNPDMKLAAVFSRRPEAVRKEIGSIPVIRTDKDAPNQSVPIDVAILCGGSKDDVPVQGPLFARRYSTVDSFDTHAAIPDYFRRMDTVARESGNVSIISAGWDPGIFSLERVLGDAFLPSGKGYTFWGVGVSQGHSDAARTVEGVIDARSYTHPMESAMEQVRDGKTPEFTSRQKHRRVVYVVAEEGADKEKIRKAITGMPNYFSDYDTEVNFISREQMAKEHNTYPHGGFVMTSGTTDKKNKQIIEYRCQLTSNPEFTGSVLVACARAAFRLKNAGHKGAYTMLDIPPALYSPHLGETLRSKYT